MSVVIVTTISPDGQTSVLVEQGEAVGLFVLNFTSTSQAIDVESTEIAIALDPARWTLNGKEKSRRCTWGLFAGFCQRLNLASSSQTIFLQRPTETVLTSEERCTLLATGTIKHQDDGSTSGGDAKSCLAQHTHRSTESRTSIECRVYRNGGPCDCHCSHTIGMEISSTKGSWAG